MKEATKVLQDEDRCMVASIIIMEIRSLTFAILSTVGLANDEVVLSHVEEFRFRH